MKKMVLVFTLAVFALSGTAFAEGNIGLYLSPDGYLDPGADDGTGSCGMAEENMPFTAYIVLSELAYPEVWGWEAAFIPDNMSFLGNSFVGEGFNAATRENEMIVALNSPLMVAGGAILVGEIQFALLYGDDPALPSHAFIEGVYFSTIDPPQGPPGVLVAPGGPVEFVHQALGDPDCEAPRPCPVIPQLIINGDCDVVGVEDSTWGSVKSLYR